MRRPFIPASERLHPSEVLVEASLSTLKMIGYVAVGTVLGAIHGAQAGAEIVREGRREKAHELLQIEMFANDPTQHETRN